MRIEDLLGRIEALERAVAELKLQPAETFYVEFTPDPDLNVTQWPGNSAADLGWDIKGDAA